MIPESIRTIVISDIHLGHSRNNTDHILNSLYMFFRNLENPATIDIIFLAGDVFDSLLDFDSNEAMDITFWIDWLLDYCSKNNIRLRVLKGTNSHDWDQSSWFLHIANLTKSPVDLRYIPNLFIENIPELDFNILYIPDEWNADNDVTYHQVLDLLKQNNLTQVDLICMHGQFDYQIPEHLKKIPRHDSSVYIPLAKYYIVIGHVHVFTTYENIIAQGSFDRLSHNEEEPKGGVELIMNKDGSKSFTRLINNNAKQFITLDIKTTDIERIYKQIDKALKNIKANSFVRLRLAKDNPLLANFKHLSIKYPNNTWAHVLDKDNTPSQSLFLDSKFTKYKSIIINRDNILDLVASKIEEKNYINKDKLLSTLKTTLKDLLI